MLGADSLESVEGNLALDLELLGLDNMFYSIIAFSVPVPPRTDIFTSLKTVMMTGLND